VFVSEYSKKSSPFMHMMPTCQVHTN